LTYYTINNRNDPTFPIDSYSNTAMATDRPPNESQVSPNLPGLTHYITGHSPSGSAIVESTRPAEWNTLLDKTFGFNVVYTTSEFPVSLNDNADLKTHDELMAKGQLGLVNPNGTVARMVDFAPGSDALMHRTQSLDYGIVIEGEIEMILDDGVKKTMHRGDVAVQRGTNHGWRNMSKTEWARMFFVLQECQKVNIGGKELGEDVSNASSGEGLASGGGGGK
jgi:quercetin dioxygenase-like cupin family protein